ncbi:MAG: hypothetical protein H3C27_06060 [Opitutaceae bacterium]|nr:hypothetical protein [Opitutaceae bacterium]
MKHTARLLLCTLALLSLTACAFVPKIGTGERRFVSNAYSADLVYIEGNIKAYRYAGSYYYFRDRRLAQVTPNLIPADQVDASN